MTNLQKESIVQISQKWLVLGEEGVFILLSDSTEAERPGYTTSEAVIENQLSETFHAAKGRILVALYASNFITNSTSF